MSKNRQHNNEAPETTPNPGVEEADMAATPAPAAPETVTQNFVLTFKRNHPQDRASYGIAGNPGIVVIQRGLVKGTTSFGTDMHALAGMPATITVSCELVAPKATAKVDREAEKAAKLAEKAEKAAAKVAAQTAKAEERKAKAEKALADAKAKLAAATTATATDATPAQS